MNIPAFPQPDCGHGRPYDSGMNLRDYFAAMAMQGMLSDASAVDEETGKKLTLPNDVELIAIVSYTMADAMMKAREA